MQWYNDCKDDSKGFAWPGWVPHHHCGCYHHRSSNRCGLAGRSWDSDPQHRSPSRIRPPMALQSPKLEFHYPYYEKKELSSLYHPRPNKINSKPEDTPSQSVHVHHIGRWNLIVFHFEILNVVRSILLHPNDSSTILSQSFQNGNEVF